MLANRVEFVEQKTQNGTAEAVRIAPSAFDREEFEAGDGNIMVLPADMPLLTTATLTHLQEHHFNSGAAATQLTAEFTRRCRLQRTVRSNWSSRPSRRTRRCLAKNSIFLKSTLVYCFKSKMLLTALEQVHNKNSQNEYYLTDVVELLNTKGNTERSPSTTRTEASKMTRDNLPNVSHYSWIDLMPNSPQEMSRRVLSRDRSTNLLDQAKRWNS